MRALEVVSVLSLAPVLIAARAVDTPDCQSPTVAVPAIAKSVSQYLPKPAAVPKSPSLTSLPTHSLYPRSTTAESTLLGSFPTNFHPPRECSTPGIGYWTGPLDTRQILYGVGSSCTGVDHDCFPTGFPYSTYAVNTLPIYSPAVECPIGWQNACNATWAANGTLIDGIPDLQNWMSPGQQLQVCCPRYWSCSFFRARSGPEDESDTYMYLDCGIYDLVSRKIEIRSCQTDEYGDTSAIVVESSFTIPGDGFLGYAPPFAMLSEIVNVAPATISNTPGSTFSAPISMIPTDGINGAGNVGQGNHTSANVPAIVGGTLGSIGGVILGSAAVLLIFRKRRNEKRKQLKAGLLDTEQRGKKRENREALEREQEISDRIHSGATEMEGHPLLELPTSPDRGSGGGYTPQMMHTVVERPPLVELGDTSPHVADSGRSPAGMPRNEVGETGSS